MSYMKGVFERQMARMGLDPDGRPRGTAAREAAQQAAQREAQARAWTPQPRPFATISTNGFQTQGTTEMSPKEEFQQTRAALVRTLMKEDSNKIIEWKGQRLPIHEVLMDIFKGGDGAIVEGLPQNDPQARAQSRAGASVLPSQEAIDALSPEHYAELQRSGGHIEGVTTPLKPRVTVRDSNGSYRIRMWKDEATGEVKTGPDDIQLGSDFYRDPNKTYWFDKIR